MPATGEYGARVLRGFTLGGKLVLPGTELAAETVLAMPTANRRALANGGKLEFVQPPIGTAVPVPPVKVEDLDPALGEFGGVTLETLNAGGVLYPPGVRLPASLVMTWPVKNRHALQGAGRVAYFREEPTPDLVGQMAASESAAVANLLS